MLKTELVPVGNTPNSLTSLGHQTVSNFVWIGKIKPHVGLHQDENHGRKTCYYLIQVLPWRLFYALVISHLDYCWYFGKHFLFICHTFTVYSKHRAHLFSSPPAVILNPPFTQAIIPAFCFIRKFNLKF
jgi:hypothetical protein